MLKQCSACGRILPASDFGPRRGQCDQCRREYCARYYSAHREEIRRKEAERYAANPKPAKARSARRYVDKRSEHIAYTREWQRKNKQKVAIRNAKWKKANPDKVREAARRRYAENPAKDIAKVQQRHALARTAKTERVSIHDIIVRDGNRCYICGVKTDPKAPYSSPFKANLEHVVPLSLGGTHTIDNLKCACRRCNTLKGAKHSPAAVATLLLGIPLVP